MRMWGGLTLSTADTNWLADDEGNMKTEYVEKLRTTKKKQAGMGAAWALRQLQLSEWVGEKN